jgi:hypothetical protein
MEYHLQSRYQWPSGDLNWSQMQPQDQGFFTFSKKLAVSFMTKTHFSTLLHFKIQLPLWHIPPYGYIEQTQFKQNAWLGGLSYAQFFEPIALCSPRILQNPSLFWRHIVSDNNSIPRIKCRHQWWWWKAISTTIAQYWQAAQLRSISLEWYQVGVAAKAMFPHSEQKTIENHRKEWDCFFHL